MTLKMKNGVPTMLLDLLAAEPCGLCQSKGAKEYALPKSQKPGRLAFKLKCLKCKAIGEFDEDMAEISAKVRKLAGATS